MTSSTPAICRTGRPAGFSPLRTRAARNSHLIPGILIARAKTCKAAFVDGLAVSVDRGSAVKRRHIGEISASDKQGQAIAGHQHGRAIARQVCKFGLDAALSGPRNDREFKPLASDAARASRTSMSCEGMLVGSVATTTRFAVRTSRLAISILFVIRPGVRRATPVRLPPGRSRLSTRPIATGSSARKMIGMVFVAVLAANAALFENARIRPSCRLTSSAACAAIDPAEIRIRSIG